jgi:hypothetical protein
MKDVLPAREAEGRVEIGPRLQTGVLGVGHEGIGRRPDQRDVQEHQEGKDDFRPPDHGKPEGKARADQGGDLDGAILFQRLEVPDLSVEQTEIQDDEVAVDPGGNGEIGDDEGVAPQPAPLQDEGRRNQVGGEGQEERAGNIENLVQGEVESRQISAVHAGDIVEGENRSEKHARG